MQGRYSPVKTMGAGRLPPRISAKSRARGRPPPVVTLAGPPTRDPIRQKIRAPITTPTSAASEAMITVITCANASTSPSTIHLPGAGLCPHTRRCESRFPTGRRDPPLAAQFGDMLSHYPARATRYILKIGTSPRGSPRTQRHAPAVLAINRSPAGTLAPVAIAPLDDGT